MNFRDLSPEILGARLRNAREYVGFSTEEIAHHLGLPEAVMSRIESGAHQAAESELRTLAKLYRTSVESLTDPEQQQLGWESFPELDQASADLSASDRDEVLRFIRFLLRQDSNADRSSSGVRNSGQVES